MRPIILTVATILAVVSCGNSSPSRPGSPQVYEAIEAETDCAELQATFDRADAGPRRPWTVEYMKAADDRMQAIGCYD